MRDPDITLSAGPTMAYPEVLAAQGRQITYHYDPVFIEHFRATERLVARVFRTHQPRDHPDAGRSGAGPRGCRSRSLADEGHARAQPRVRGLRQGLRPLADDFGAELHELEVPYDHSVDPPTSSRTSTIIPRPRCSRSSIARRH